MDYFAAFDISASGMEVQKVRLDTVALNLANVNTTRTANGGPYQPLQVVIAEKSGAAFAHILQTYQQKNSPAGVEVVDVKPLSAQARMVYEPAHPDANEKGFVAYPDINPVSEMVNLMDSGCRGNHGVTAPLCFASESASQVTSS